MATATIKVTLNSDIQTVWSIVTSLSNYLWRSDLEKIEVLEENKKFVEYSKDGFATTFTITTFNPLKRYEFDLENDNMKGHWTGLFEETNVGTIIQFTEDITAKKMILKPMVSIYLKNQQKRYIKDLQNILEN